MNTYHLIANLFHRYADHIDNGELQKVAELLKDCTISDGDGNILASGHDEILTMYTGMIRIYPETNTPQTQHVLSNLIVEGQAKQNEVKASANFSVLQKLESGSIEPVICGKYQNTFRLVDDIWTFHQHTMHPRIIGDLSRHLTITL